MAIMIPNDPADFNDSDGEAEVFEALRKLDDDYYVHSLCWLNSKRAVPIQRGAIAQGEADFAIFNARHGIAGSPITIAKKTGTPIAEITRTLFDLYAQGRISLTKNPAKALFYSLRQDLTDTSTLRSASSSRKNLIIESATSTNSYSLWNRERSRKKPSAVIWESVGRTD